MFTCFQTRNAHLIRISSKNTWKTREYMSSGKHMRARFSKHEIVALEFFVYLMPVLKIIKLYFFLRCLVWPRSPQTVPFPSLSNLPRPLRTQTTHPTTKIKTATSWTHLPTTRVVFVKFRSAVINSSRPDRASRSRAPRNKMDTLDQTSERIQLLTQKAAQNRILRCKIMFLFSVEYKL